MDATTFHQSASRPRHMRNYSREEVLAVMNNIVAMNLEHGSVWMAVMNDTSFYELDNLFNGAPN